MSIWVIHPVCPQAIFPIMVTLFASVMLCVTNIPSKNDNDNLFCSELNEEHAEEGFVSLHFIVLGFTNEK